MPFLCALVFGVVAGSRSMLAPALVSWAASLGLLNVSLTPLAFMGYHYTHWILTLLAVGELIVDKLPSTPSRTAPLPFIGRILTGALSGSVVGFSAHSLPFCILLGVLGAVAGTLGGYQGRKQLAAYVGSDFPAALLEDVVAVGVGICAVMSL